MIPAHKLVEALLGEEPMKNDFMVMLRLPAELKMPIEKLAAEMGIGVSTLIRIMVLRAYREKRHDIYKTKEIGK